MNTLPALRISGKCLLLASLILLAFHQPVRAGQYGETFDAFADGATNLSPAGELFSNQLGTTAKVVDATVKELQLTADGSAYTLSAFRLPELDSGSAVCAFSAKWNSQIYGSTAAGLADGLSFNFGPLTGPAAFFTNSTNVNEAGFGIGLSVGVTTYDGNTAGYYARVNGAIVGFFAKPASAWGSFNTTRHFFEVDWHYFTGLTLRVDGVSIFTNLPTPGFVPDVGHRFVFGARTGGLDQEVRLDNILIVTGGVLTPLAAGAPYHFSAENLPLEGASQAFDNNSGTKWLAATATANLGASLAFPTTIRAYTLSSANDVPGRDPKNWAFETGDNGTTWTSRATKSLQYFFNRFEKRAFLVNSPASNSRFRLNITANNGSPETQLADIQAWELTPGPVFFKVGTLTDSGASDSLRTALTVAASASSQAVITFSSNIAGGTISPASEFIINDSAGVAIDASNLTGGIILNGNSARRIMANTGTGPVKLSGLTFTGGNGVSTIQGPNGGAFFAADFTSSTFTRCTFHNNTGSNGAGLINLGQMRMDDCTLYNNHSTTQAGAIQNEEVLTLSRCTITGNTAASYGGAIQNQDRLTAVHCTITGNTASGASAGGGGIDIYGAPLTSVTNSIVAKNTAIGVGADILIENATLTRVGANIIQGFFQRTGGLGAGPPASAADPLLAPLGNYGGPTQTMALKPGSPARNSAVGSTSTVDQRSFPMIGNPDIGAYEAGTITNFDNWVWESLPATATDPQHAAGADFDGDKQTNLQEWIAVTNPADGNSFLKVTAVSLDGVILKVTFPTVVGRSYSAEYSTDGIGWTSLGYAPGTGNVFVVNIGPLTGLTRFFARCRVKIP